MDRTCSVCPPNSLPGCLPSTCPPLLPPALRAFLLTLISAPLPLGPLGTESLLAPTRVLRCEARAEWAPRSAPNSSGVPGFCQIYRDTTSPPSQIPSPRPSGSPVLPNALMLTSLFLISQSRSRTTRTPVVLLVSIPIILKDGHSSCSAIITWSPYHGEGQGKLSILARQQGPKA